MTNTKHGSTNYRAVLPFVEGMTAEGTTSRKYRAGEFMPLSVEFLHYNDHNGHPVFSMAHYGEQNGDLMRDPEMTFSVDRAGQRIEPLTFRNDYLGLYQRVYIHDEQGRLCYSKRLRTELDEFLWLWLRNIKDQGYSL